MPEFTITITPKARPSGSIRHLVTVWTNASGTWRAEHQFDFPEKNSAYGAQIQRDAFVSRGFNETPETPEIAAYCAQFGTDEAKRRTK